VSCQTRPLWSLVTDSSSVKMNTLISHQVIMFAAAIEQAGIPALGVAFSIAVLIFLYGGVLIFRRRHELFDRDPDVENDVPFVRHNPMEGILLVWTGLTTMLLIVLIQVW
jgi:hypothetical protein